MLMLFKATSASFSEGHPPPPPVRGLWLRDPEQGALPPRPPLISEHIRLGWINSKGRRKGAFLSFGYFFHRLFFSFGYFFLQLFFLSAIFFFNLVFLGLLSLCFFSGLFFPRPFFSRSFFPDTKKRKSIVNLPNCLHAC